MALRLLIVDDDVDDRELLRAAVSTIYPSIECEEAVDGYDTLTLLNRTTTLPDFIFLDLNMPRIDGFQCLKEIKENENWKNISIIVYCQSKRTVDKETALKLGALHFITKSHELVNLQKEIRFVFEKK
jgi:DNA-binding response OmpR family regulator